MKRHIKLPTDEIAKIDFTQKWTVTPFMVATLTETSIDDVVFSQDGKTGMISYDTLDLTEPHTYSYVTDSGVQQYTVPIGIHGRPLFYDQSMQEITEQDIQDLLTQYEPYQINKAYATEDKFTFEEKLYIVVQGHTSQEDWRPDELPALYRHIYPETVIAPWVQPLGSHDAYQMGDKVTHNGKTWESTINDNVWEPGAPGIESLWKEI